MTDKGGLVLQGCTDTLRVVPGLCSETSGRSSVDGNEVTITKVVGEAIHIKQEVEPVAITFPSIKVEPEVSPKTFHQNLGLPTLIMSFCLPVFPHKSAPYGEWKWSVCTYRE